MHLPKQELQQITGGSITASLVQAVTNGFKMIFNFGTIVGSAFHRIIHQNWC